MLDGQKYGLMLNINFNLFLLYSNHISISKTHKLNK